MEEENKEKVDNTELKKFVDSVLSIEKWVWPMTILLYIIRWIGYDLDLFYMAHWQASIFLWGPFAIVFGVLSLFLVASYILGLFISWLNFVSTIAAFFKAGFNDGSNGE